MFVSKCEKSVFPTVQNVQERGLVSWQLSHWLIRLHYVVTKLSAERWALKFEHSGPIRSIKINTTTFCRWKTIHVYYNEVERINTVPSKGQLPWTYTNIFASATWRQQTHHCVTSPSYLQLQKLAMLGAKKVGAAWETIYRRASHRKPCHGEPMIKFSVVFPGRQKN